MSDEARIRVKRDDDLAVEFNNTSMTDVIFILLIFFISLSQVRTSSLDVKLPTVSSKGDGAADRTKPVVIEVSRDDAILFDGEKVDAAGLGARIAALRVGGREEPRVRIRGDKAAKNGTMMEVVAALASAGITKLEFAVKTAPPE